MSSPEPQITPFESEVKPYQEDTRLGNVDNPAIVLLLWFNHELFVGSTASVTHILQPWWEITPYTLEDAIDVIDTVG